MTSPSAPTQQQLDTLATVRNEVLASAKPLIDSSLVYSVDIERIRADDEYVSRFLRAQDWKAQEAVDMIVNCLKWRKEFNVLDIKESMFDSDVLNNGTFFFRNRDKSGRLVGHLLIAKHKKDASKLITWQKYIVLWFERQEKSARPKTEKFTIIFDMSGAGLGNLDMDLVKFLIDCFKHYYPNMLGQILVFEMPWLLSAAWGVIKSWLSPKAIQIIKFVTKKDITDYIESSSLLSSQGGLDRYEYTYSPGEFAIVERNDFNLTPSGAKHSSSANGSSTSLPPSALHTPTPTSNSTPTSPTEEPQRVSSSSGKKRVSFKPPDVVSDSEIPIQVTPNPNFLEFTGPFEGEVFTPLLLSNPSSSTETYAFKIKTTSPERYRVRPFQGMIPPGASVKINVYMHLGQQFTASLPSSSDLQQLSPADSFVASIRDKFLLLLLPLPTGFSPANSNIEDLWQKSSTKYSSLKPIQHRLPCKFISSTGQILGAVPEASSANSSSSDSAVLPSAPPAPSATASAVSAVSAPTAVAAVAPSLQSTTNATTPATSLSSTSMTANASHLPSLPTSSKLISSSHSSSANTSNDVGQLQSQVIYLSKQIRFLQFFVFILWLTVCLLAVSVVILSANQANSPQILKDFVTKIFELHAAVVGLFPGNVTKK